MSNQFITGSSEATTSVHTQGTLPAQSGLSNSQTTENLEKLTRAAWLYYIDGLKQSEIAKMMFVSRPTVGRLLQQARELGIVHLDVDTTHLADTSLAQSLQEIYGLSDTVVIPAPNPDLSPQAQNDRVAAAAAMHISAHLHPGAVIGVAWGETVQQVLTHLAHSSLDGVTFAALSGGIEYLNSRIAAYPDVVEQLQPIPAPLFVSTALVAETLRKEELVKAVLDLGKTAEVTLTSIGTPSVAATINRTGVLPPEELERARAAGAVGDMLGQWFDSSGCPVSFSPAHFHIGLSLDDLRNQKEVIGVAAGKHKADAVHAALVGNYLDELVTDETIARILVERGARSPVTEALQRSRTRSNTTC